VYPAAIEPATTCNVVLIALFFPRPNKQPRPLEIPIRKVNLNYHLVGEHSNNLVVEPDW